MSSKVNVLWPSEVAIPESIGYRIYDDNNGPCCAIGHMRKEFYDACMSIKPWDGQTLSSPPIQDVEDAVLYSPHFKDKIVTRPAVEEWKRVYVELFKVFLKILPKSYFVLNGIKLSKDHIAVKGHHIECINDEIDDTLRLKLYLLTWAKLGYVKNMPRGILNLLKVPGVARISVRV